MIVNFEGLGLLVGWMPDSSNPAPNATTTLIHHHHHSTTTSAAALFLAQDLATSYRFILQSLTRLSGRHFGPMAREYYPTPATNQNTNIASAENAAAVAREAYKFLKDPVVHQMVKTFAIPLASSLIAWYKGPTQQNPTVQEIEARHRRQADETAEVRRRRMVRDQEAMEEQRREEVERARNAMAIAESYRRKYRELELVHMRGVLLRQEHERNQAREQAREQARANDLR